MNSFIGGFYGCVKVGIRTVESGIFVINIVFFGYSGSTIGDSGIDCADLEKKAAANETIIVGGKINTT